MDTGKASKELQIPQAFDGLSSTIERLESAVSLIGDRINRTMRSELVPNNKGTEVAAYSTPLAEDIRVQAERISTQVDLLKVFIDRLEI